MSLPILIDTSSVRNSNILSGFSGLADSDWLFAWVLYVAYTSLPAAPSGWVLVDVAETELLPSFPGSFHGMACYRREVTDATSEPVSYTFPDGLHVIGSAWRGCDTDDPVDAVAKVSYHDLDNPVEGFDIPGITTLTDDSRCIAGIAHSSVPAGEGEEAAIHEVAVESYLLVHNGPFNYQQIYQLAVSPPAIVPTKMVTLDGSVRFYDVIVIAVRPGAAGPVPAGSRFDCLAIDSQIN